MIDLMKSICFFKGYIVLFAIVLSCSGVPDSADMDCYIFLSDTEDNRVAQVEIKVGNLKDGLKDGLKDSAVFRFPKVVNGTYSTQYCGRHITDFICYDVYDSVLISEKIDSTDYFIPQSSNINRIVYTVENNLSNDGATCSQTIKRDSFYLLNFQSVIGYFENKEHLSYKLHIINSDHRDKRSGYTSLQKADDVFTADNYFELVDSPMIYGVGDTLSISCGNTTFFVSIFSENKMLTTQKLKPKLVQACSTVKHYFSDAFEENYHILLYSENMLHYKKYISGLEHRNSTVIGFDEYSLYDTSNSNFENAIIRVLIHELVHQITPIKIHDKEMTVARRTLDRYLGTEHLWLYEGIVDYISYRLALEILHLKPNKFLTANVDGLSILKRLYRDTDLLALSRIVGDNSVYNSRKRASFRNVHYFYATALPVGFLLDLEIMKIAPSKNIVTVLNEMLQDNQPFDKDSVFQHFAKYTSSEIVPFLDSLLSSYAFCEKKYEQSLGFFGLEAGMDSTSKKQMFSLPFIIIDYEIKDGRILSEFTMDLAEYKIKRGTEFYLEKIDDKPITKLLIRSCIDGFSPDKTSRVKIQFSINGKQQIISVTPHAYQYLSFTHSFKFTNTCTDTQRLRYADFFKTTN
ncbi:MAG: hypothetical protein LBQ31_05500 [Bacteroidales bacterium]|jgi:predicted metalloprotease with PDZ domain|nr:hypothetical protein [Bacteroidales bacterium]